MAFSPNHAGLPDDHGYGFTWPHGSKRTVGVGSLEPRHPTLSFPGGPTAGATERGCFPTRQLAKLADFTKTRQGGVMLPRHCTLVALVYPGPFPEELHVFLLRFSVDNSTPWIPLVHSQPLSGFRIHHT